MAGERRFRARVPTGTAERAARVLPGRTVAVAARGVPSGFGHDFARIPVLGVATAPQIARGTPASPGPAIPWWKREPEPVFDESWPKMPDEPEPTTGRFTIGNKAERPAADTGDHPVSHEIGCGPDEADENWWCPPW